MKNEKYEYIINELTKSGIDFADIYFETSKRKVYTLSNSEIESINTNTKKGIGIRTSLNELTRYTASNDISDSNIDFMINQHKNNYDNKSILGTISLKEEQVKNINPIKEKHNEYKSENKIEILHKIDSIAREYSNLVTQVKATFIEEDKDFEIASTRGFIKRSTYTNTRLTISIFVEEEGKKESSFERIGAAKGYEFLNDLDIETLTKTAVEKAINKLHAETIKGGKYPVILASGFGAVLFHEACGHGLEATSVAPKTSCFTDKLNEKIASDIVTLIDDGTIPNAWGSISVDDEGTETEKRVLIENGVLKTYMVDYLNKNKMNHRVTGSGRRQDYTFEPTSRMTNTYIAPGKDKVEDMIKSIEYGVYCESLGGGLVDTASGNFNFQVESAKLIENGKLTKSLRDLCLIGTGKEIINRVEMISDDLVISDGYCGSESGSVFVTVGQPTIKISKMQVGGKNE